MNPNEVAGLADARETEEMVHRSRWGVIQRVNDWHNDIQTSREVAAGKLLVKLPDGSVLSRLAIENLYNDNAQDAKRLAAEDPGTMYLQEPGNAAAEDKLTALRQAVARGYWTEVDAEALEFLYLDYILAGGMFLLSDADKDQSKYPLHTILDPMGCYPTFGRRHDQLSEFVYSQTISARTLAQQYPNFTPDSKESAMVEEITLWTPQKISKVASYASNKDQRGKVHFLESGPNEIGRVPISFAVETAEDRTVAIPFIQMIDVLRFNNTGMGMVQHHLEKGIYAPLWVRDEVDTSEYGPEGEVRGIGPNAEAHPMQPAQMDPAFFGIIRTNEQAARGGGSYPAQRQGQQLPSIGSGAMIAAISGERASLIRYIQRRMGSLLRQQKNIDRAIDVKYLDFSKSLLAPAEGRKTYTPSDVWKEGYECRFNHVFGNQGLPALDHNLAIQGSVGLGLMPKKIARRHDPNIPDPEDAERQVILEDMIRVFTQETMATMPYPAQMRLIHEVWKNGKHPFDAVEELQAHPEELQAPAPAGQPGAQPGPVPTPSSPAEANLAMQKGANPADINFPGLGPEAQKPPLSNVLVNIRPGR